MIVREGDYLYQIIATEGGSESKVLYGTVNKTEIGVRIDNNTVADITSQFDLTLGEYVETGRVTRAEPLPPVPPSTADEINSLKSRQADLIFAMVDKNLM